MELPSQPSTPTSDRPADVPPEIMQETDLVPPESEQDHSNKVLRKGDLARIAEIGTGRLKDRGGQLARIISAVEADNPEHHPFTYDIEFVLGGKLTKVERYLLLYTTAQQEGMTGESRARRKRKPNSLFKAEPSKNEAAAAKKKLNAANKRLKKTVAGAKTSATAKKRPNEKTTTKAVAKKRSKVSVSDTESSKSAALAMYERHRREFERSVTRLEKVDSYGWFLSDVPTEFDECYDAPEQSTNDANLSATTPSTPQHEQSDTESSIASSVATTYDVATSHTTATKKKTQKTSNSTTDTGLVFPNHPPYNWKMIRRRMEFGRYVLKRPELEEEERFQLLQPYWISIGKNVIRKKNLSLPVLHEQGVHWDLFRTDVLDMCDAAIARDATPSDTNLSAGTISHAVKKIQDTLEQIYERCGKRQIAEMATANDRHRFALAIDKCSNHEAAMQGKWRRSPFPERKYERLDTDVVCAGLSKVDEKVALYELKTNLKNSFVGLSYTYDDTGQSEGWMKSLVHETNDEGKLQTALRALASDDGVLKAQVAATMQSLVIQVQDRVMTEGKVLEQQELRSVNWELASSSSNPSPDKSTRNEARQSSGPSLTEQEVWGIDCYTRKNISICLDMYFDQDTILEFIEKWLLPAINACPIDLASDISNAARILEGRNFEPASSTDTEGGTTIEEWKISLLGRSLLNKIHSFEPAWLKAAAQVLRRAKEAVGHDFFRVHPKGHGSILLSPRIGPNRLITYYRGEVYPSWRWGEKMDAIAITQEKKGLKPVLPDFFNMALERPQIDPRGYSLLFVDASRKSGYGSMLSHSCQPTCEVRVVALNGELKLAMTTLRELTMGEELTFDYNAVTESLNEYQSAVCLCGYGRCRGSFLHFATADCYQQVLNRNSPIAVRLSNLIKGCMKQVMAEDDEVILQKHGFNTAAFGAISVNRRTLSFSTQQAMSMDSISLVPVWLRTFVADTLRYIEYERRALPIALICNHLNNDDESQSAKAESAMSAKSTSEEKAPRASRPEPSFFLYARTNREEMISRVEQEGKGHLTGNVLKKEIQRMAADCWKALGEDEKAEWKNRARAEWEVKNRIKKAQPEQDKLPKNGKVSKSELKRKSETNPDKKSADGTKDATTTELTFQGADAEGISAMEQRIQQLTQSLSRVGRVLDRHREKKLQGSDGLQPSAIFSGDQLREHVHSPMVIMPNEHVIAWAWNHEEGVVRQLLKHAKNESCVSPSLRQELAMTEAKYNDLKSFGTPWSTEENGKTSDSVISGAKGRKLLTEALLEFRKNLLDGIKSMQKEIHRHRSLVKKEQEKKRIESADERIRDEVRLTMNQLLQGVMQRVTGISEENEMSESESIQMQSDVESASERGDELDDDSQLQPWLQNYNKRFKLEKSADLLLLYAKTSTFFALKNYEELQSSSIEIYARELGNDVPLSVIDKEVEVGHIAEDKVDDSDKISSLEPQKAAKRKGSCEPEDIVTKVVVEYGGDYVLSQLLQWYNGGIGQKPGLPDMLGCALLPSIAGCWTIDGTQGSHAKTVRSTRYQSTTRKKLIEWFKDPLKRGSPWSDDIKRAFVDGHSTGFTNNSSQWLPFGSPILDFLVTGDDYDLTSVIQTLESFHNTKKSSDDSKNDAMLSSVDHGRPAQAVSNWVQCENPKCLKWRKVPWHVDIDMLSEKFYCKENKWNLNAASCDAPEDEWDSYVDTQVVDGSADQAFDVENRQTAPPTDEPTMTTSCKLSDFVLGARFDVLKNKKWIVASVVKVDFSGEDMRVKFHYSKTPMKNDEWVDASSARIAPPKTKARPRKQSTKHLSNANPQKKTAPQPFASSINVVEIPAKHRLRAKLEILARKNKQMNKVGLPAEDNIAKAEKSARKHTDRPAMEQAGAIETEPDVEKVSGIKLVDPAELFDTDSSSDENESDVLQDSVKSDSESAMPEEDTDVEEETKLIAAAEADDATSYLRNDGMSAEDEGANDKNDGSLKASKYTAKTTIRKGARDAKENKSQYRESANEDSSTSPRITRIPKKKRVGPGPEERSLLPSIKANPNDPNKIPRKVASSKKSIAPKSLLAFYPDKPNDKEGDFKGGSNLVPDNAKPDATEGSDLDYYDKSIYCQAYVKHGYCSFNDNCRYVHPPMHNTIPPRSRESARIQHRPIDGKVGNTKGSSSMAPDKTKSIAPKAAKGDDFDYNDKSIFCQAFIKHGLCNYGDNCRYVHPVRTNTPPTRPRQPSETRHRRGAHRQPPERHAPGYRTPRVDMMRHEDSTNHAAHRPKPNEERPWNHPESMSQHPDQVYAQNHRDDDLRHNGFETTPDPIDYRRNTDQRHLEDSRAPTGHLHLGREAHDYRNDREQQQEYAPMVSSTAASNYGSRENEERHEDQSREWNIRKVKREPYLEEDQTHGYRNGRDHQQEYTPMVSSMAANNHSSRENEERQEDQSREWNVRKVKREPHFDREVDTFQTPQTNISEHADHGDRRHNLEHPPNKEKSRGISRPTFSDRYDALRNGSAMVDQEQDEDHDYDRRHHRRSSSGSRRGRSPNHRAERQYSDERRGKRRKSSRSSDKYEPDSRRHRSPTRSRGRNDCDEEDRSDRSRWSRRDLYSDDRGRNPDDELRRSRHHKSSRHRRRDGSPKGRRHR